MAVKTRNRRADAIYLILALLMAPIAAGLTITGPTGTIIAQEMPTTITAEWEDGTGPYTLDLNGSITTTNQTKQSYDLQEGQYQLTVTGQNNSDTTTFTIEQEPAQISITTDKQSYEVGSIVRLTATSNRPVSATLVLNKEGTTKETYTLSIDGSVDLFYIPEEAGSYTATLTADETTASAAWTAESVQQLSIDFTYDEPVKNEKTTFTASVAGGKSPYAYQWLYSDDTAGTGATNEHYFFEAGQHSATLIVTDADNTQKSITKSFMVQEQTYSLEIVVRDQQDRLLKDITAKLRKQSTVLEKKTDSSGIAEFNGLLGNYTLELLRLDDSYLNTTVNMSKDRNLLFTIEYGNQNQTTQQNTTEQNDTQDTAPEPVQLKQEQPEQTAKEIAEKELADARQEALDDLSEQSFNFKLDTKKDRVLKHLKLYAVMEETTEAVKKAESEDEIEKLLKKTPTEVRIIDEKNALAYPQPDEIDNAIKDFLDSKGVTDEKLSKKYIKNIKETAKNVSVKTNLIRAMITYGEGQEEHTIIKREITGAKEAYIIENIPKAFAADVSEMRIEGEYDVLESDPILRFTSDTYTYSAATDEPAPDLPIVVPYELKDYGMLAGLMSVTVGDSDPKRSMLYALLIAMLAGGLVMGRKVTQGRTGKEFEAFASLAQDAMELISQGNQQQIAAIAPEITAIYEELPRDQQAQLSDVMNHITGTAKQQEFLQTMDHTFRTVGQSGGDVNIITQAYEQAISAYEQLPDNLQEQLKERLTQLDEYLDNAIQT